tara:strand:+ start:2545 stop:2910 length:366 start_codon:yes stop_codon:yes gene_type:complete
MANFAKLGTGNIIEKVVVVSNQVITDNDGNEQEQLGVDFLNNLYKTRDVWKQTSFNNNFRKNFAGIGYTYDEQRDAFIPPKRYPSWILDEETCLWKAPIDYPEDDKNYNWNEELKNWEELV